MKREIEFAHDTAAAYLLIVPGAVGRPQAVDETEFHRSVESTKLIAPMFEEGGGPRTDAVMMKK